jgi:hypothetical protein
MVEMIEAVIEATIKREATIDTADCHAPAGKAAIEAGNATIETRRSHGDDPLCP